MSAARQLSGDRGSARLKMQGSRCPASPLLAQCPEWGDAPSQSTPINVCTLPMIYGRDRRKMPRQARLGSLSICAWEARTWARSQTAVSITTSIPGLHYLCSDNFASSIPGSSLMYNAVSSALGRPLTGCFHSAAPYKTGSSSTFTSCIERSPTFNRF